MGSPRTYNDLWKDLSYTKTKDILEVGDYDKDYDRLRDKEPTLIKESWNEYGVYLEGGRSLNVRAGKIVHKNYLIGDRNPSKRNEVREKLSLLKKEEYKNKTPPYLTPEAKKKARIGINKYYEQEGVDYPIRNYWLDKSESNPSKRPEIRESKSKKMMDHYSDPSERKKASERTKKWHENYEMSDETKRIISNKLKLRYSDLSERKKISEKKKEWHKHNTISDETRKKLSDAGKARFARGDSNPFSNPEIHAKAWATRRKNIEEKNRKQQMNTLENYFE